jgi:hypothetical protein
MRLIELYRYWMRNLRRLLMAKERKRIREALSIPRFKSISVDELHLYQVDGVMTLQTFKENVSKLFPLVLSLTVEGQSLPSIARLMGISHRALKHFIETTPKAVKAMNDARKIRSDDIELRELLS